MERLDDLCSLSISRLGKLKRVSLRPSIQISVIGIVLSIAKKLSFDY